MTGEKVVKMVGQFRDKFVLNSKLLNWFPGHMTKGVKKVNAMLHKIDCIIEIHDARVPFTGRNTRFQRQLSEMRPHCLILNKVDLCNPDLKDPIKQYIQDEEKVEKVFYTNLRKNNQVNNIMPDLLKMIRKSERYQRSDKSEINLLVSGIPNVGKSTFLSHIKNSYCPGGKSIFKQGANPGVTIAVQEKVKISSTPLIYMYDTPGILEPKFKNEITDPLKLAACNLLSIERIGSHNVADYLLFWLNMNGHFSYVDKLNLDAPIDNVDEFLVKICVKNDLFITRNDTTTKNFVRRPHTEMAAIKFIKLFQKAKLGRFTLDNEKFE